MGAPRFCGSQATVRGLPALPIGSATDHRGFDLISDVLPFGRLWYDTSENAIGYAMHSSRSHDAVIRVYDAAGNVIETHKDKGEFQRAVTRFASLPNGFSPLKRGRPPKEE